MSSFRPYDRGDCQHLALPPVLARSSARANGVVYEFVLEFANLFLRNLPYQHAFLNNQNSVRQFADEIKRLLDQNHCHGVRALQFQQMIGNFVNDGWLNAFGRLVEKYERRFTAETSSNGEDLLLTAAQNAGSTQPQRRQTRERRDN